MALSFLPLASVQPLPILPLVLPLPIGFTMIVFFSAHDAQQNVQHGTSLAAAQVAVIFLSSTFGRSSSCSCIAPTVDNSAARHPNESIETLDHRLGSDVPVMSYYVTKKSRLIIIVSSSCSQRMFATFQYATHNLIISLAFALTSLGVKTGGRDRDCRWG